MGRIPALETQELRTELWEVMIGKVGERTLAEWQQVFATNPNVMAEVYRAGPDVLDHPQLTHDGRIAVTEDRSLGKIRQPSTLVHCEERPLCPPRPAPGVDEHGAELRERAERGLGHAVISECGAEEGLPLDGITVVEFALQYAGPYGATLLTDLGARVIKVESLDGDTIRRVTPFPEASGAKVMQGKESICLDLRTDEGLRIAHGLVEKADVVLQSFRAGAAERAKIDSMSLKAINPDLVYLNASGYGTGGPFGARPAYAPSIGAAFGFALTDTPDAAGVASGSLAEIKVAAARLNTATAVPTIQADGVAAMAVASAMLLGLLARKRGRPLGALTTTMIASANHALLDRVIDYPGKPAPPMVDAGGYGFSALYRMYRAADGWVFLAAPKDSEWAALVAALAGEADLTRPQFATSSDRAENEATLADILGVVFARKPAAEWEQTLTRADVGCVEVTEIRPERHLQTNDALSAEYCTTAMSPVFDEHLRMGPTVRFSRSSTQAEGGCMAGDHTDSILTELGFDEAAIADLRDRSIVG